MAKTLSKLTEALLETADEMHGAGLMGDDTYRKITVRHLGPDAPLAAEPITPEEIRRVREEAEHNDRLRRQVQIGLDSAAAGRLIPAAEVEAKFAARRAATRQRLAVPE